MNTNSTATTEFDGALHSSSMALALACALLAPATTIQAAKPKPAPTPSGPAYRIIPVEPFVMPTAINSSGALVGQWIHDYDPNAGGPYLSAFSLAPALINGSVQYLNEDIL
jgi:hypothetical protein